MSTPVDDQFAGEVRRYMGRMDGALSTIADAMVKIARLEERHQETRESLGRAFDRMDKSDEVQSAHTVVIATIQEQIKPLAEVRGWAVSGVLAVFGLVCVAIVGLVLVK